MQYSKGATPKQRNCLSRSTLIKKVFNQATATAEKLMKQDKKNGTKSAQGKKADKIVKNTNVLSA